MKPKFLCFLLATVLFCLSHAYAQDQVASIVPYQLRCEYLVNPHGIDELKPRLSWTLKASDTTAFGQLQTAYRIVVASSPALLASKPDCWDSGWVKTDQMQQVVYEGKGLVSDRHYFWKVLVRDERGRIAAPEEAADWTTGLLKASDWTAQWIGTDQRFDPAQADCNIIDPWLRKTFSLTKAPSRATLFLASVGYHELYVNGKRIGEGVLAPAVTDHTKRARYIAYEIAAQLHPGKNVIAIWLGTSWSIFGPYVTPDKTNTPVVIAQTKIHQQGLPSVLVQTDASWKTQLSPNKLLGKWDFAQMGGELYDARRERNDWNLADCDESSWEPAVVYEPKLKLSAQMVEQNRLFEEIRPVRVTARADGSFRVDMGVNFAGFTEVKLKGKPGDRIDFLYSERQQEDMTFNLHSAYIIGNSGAGTFRNRFNYSSARWITIRGLKEKPELSDIRGWMVRTDYQPAAAFACADSLQNWIYDRVKWTYQNLSLGGYVVDCPQRERLGYGGDAHATCETGMYNFKVGAFYTKWMQDWRDVQGTESIVGNMFDPAFARKGLQGGRILNNGILPHTAPTYSGGGGPAWGGIVVTLPWFVYQHQRDTRILEENFELIRGWLSFLDTHTENHMLQRFGGSWDFLGDWLWPGAGKEGMNNDKPETLCLNNCYRVFNLMTAAKIARVLHRDEQAAEWEMQAVLARQAINKRFYNPGDHSYADSSMVNLAAALLAEVPDEELRPAVMERLETEILVNKKGHIHVGITGGAILFKLLRDLGRDDLIYSMTSQVTYPSWGYMKQNDATTIWEMWEKDLPGHSLLHSSYLYPGAWYIDGLAGIRKDPESPGFQHFILRPPTLTEYQMPWARASFDSPAGTIYSAWQREKGVLTMQVRVPPNCRATLQLRRPESDIVWLNDKKAESTVNDEGFAEFILPAGAYEIKATPAR